MPNEPQDIIVEARELADHLAGMREWRSQKQVRTEAVLRQLADEVERGRKALKLVVQLWDANNPDDPCGCVGASDDCRYPPTCELCVARMVMEGRNPANEY